jgi:hypothetical protein
MFLLLFILLELLCLASSEKSLLDDDEEVCCCWCLKNAKSADEEMIAVCGLSHKFHNNCIRAYRNSRYSTNPDFCPDCEEKMSDDLLSKYPIQRDHVRKIIARRFRISQVEIISPSSDPCCLRKSYVQMESDKSLKFSYSDITAARRENSEKMIEKTHQKKARSIPCCEYSSCNIS